MYGAPAPYVTGLDFDPTSFVASATGGGADITDGQLNFTVMGQKDVAIGKIGLSEGGDYTLVGAGTAASQALAGAVIFVKVTEIDGSPVPAINLSPVNASVGYNLPANGGIVNPWSLSLLVDVGAQLTSMQVPFVLGATKAEVAINNFANRHERAGERRLHREEGLRHRHRDSTRAGDARLGGSGPLWRWRRFASQAQAKLLAVARPE